MKAAIETRRASPRSPPARARSTRSADEVRAPRADSARSANRLVADEFLRPRRRPSTSSRRRRRRSSTGTARLRRLGDRRSSRRRRSPECFARLTDAVRKGGTAVERRRHAVAPSIPSGSSSRAPWRRSPRMTALLLANLLERREGAALEGVSTSRRGTGCSASSLARAEPERPGDGASTGRTCWRSREEHARQRASRIASARSPAARSRCRSATGYDLVLLPNFLHHFDPPTLRAAAREGARRARARRPRRDRRVRPRRRPLGPARRGALLARHARRHAGAATRTRSPSTRACSSAPASTARRSTSCRRRPARVVIAGA